jgi:hypothetical protein
VNKAMSDGGKKSAAIRIDRTCDQCGRDFLGTAKQIHCSRSCYFSARRARHKQIPMELTNAEHARIKEFAAEQGVSMMELLRRGLRAIGAIAEGD